MALGKQALKQRIRSINATKKITSAMELIANSKLQKQRNLMEKNREYANVLKKTVGEILANNQGLDNQFLQEKKSDKRCTFIFCSDLGLCGGYNSNMMRLAQEVLNPDDPVFLIGTKQIHWMELRKFNVINEYISSDNITFVELKDLVDQAIEMFKKDEVSGIQILYTEFVNTVTFNPVMETLLPYFAKKEDLKKEVSTVATDFEPSPNEILNSLIPMMLENVVYSIWMQTKTAEQGSRRLAMENATDNATELNDKFVLAYNQARQAAITQEITEIVAGADAL
ncbi:ATP synthase F1 subunit gamma [Anaerorhabdus furcosa]|uniref:ATP synthase gamma chain n=1 Tax=Anaerorhabdus furcosa TaxID=118967 RepID=A0A1T4KAN7_9FIRM|nr:ATP synthase F1 subunit gamma [Anaerorhabdus furcosa]SJZ39504.1 F-type H+-transporting ATPase subunit gamma [Anaerorhabdus furcosa]